MSWRNAHTDPPPKSGTYLTRDTRHPGWSTLRYVKRRKVWVDGDGIEVVFGSENRQGQDEWRER